MPGARGRARGRRLGDARLPRGYAFDREDGRVAIALGFGSLDNHEPEPNAEYEADHDTNELVVRARRPIAAGEEITIDDTGGGSVELWFDPAC